MNTGRLIFTQVIDLLDRKEFQRCIEQHPMPRVSKGKTSRDQFLAYANEHRGWHVYEALAQVLICKARRLYREDFNGLDIDEMVYAVDVSTIDLCLSIFPWAHFRKTKAEIKRRAMARGLERGNLHRQSTWA